MPFSQRCLPHYYAIDRPIFFTFCLHDAIPPGRGFSKEVTKSGKAFVCLDRLLEEARTGPLYLKIPAVAQCVADAIRQGSESNYVLHEWVIMPNHVHLLITPRIAVGVLLQKLKGTTARTANQLLGRTGLPFWQRECYDRIVRNADEFGRIGSYIVKNPVRAGLAPTAELYPWCSASSVGALGGLKPTAG
jgi:REP element-mobilizing transposase RayT